MAKNTLFRYGEMVNLALAHLELRRIKHICWQTLIRIGIHGLMKPENVKCKKKDARPSKDHVYAIY